MKILFFKFLPGVLLLFLWLAASQGQAPDPAQWNVDKSLFPQAYGLLANEQLLYPIDQRDWPVKIDNSRQLFLDDYLIASLENVRRTLNPARKHPQNPLIDQDKPWEGRGPVFHTVMRNEKTGKFRMGTTVITILSCLQVRSFAGRLVMPSRTTG